MDFAFTSDQVAIRDTAARFARERLAPAYKARETAGVIDRQLVRDMGELGLIGADLPEKFGAPGLDSVTTGIIIEEISRGDISVGYVQLLGSLMGSIVAAHARPEVADEIVPKICSGEAIVALGLTEPRGGSDAAHLQTKARADGDGYVLSGEKTSISMAESEMSSP